MSERSTSETQLLFTNVFAEHRMDNDPDTAWNIQEELVAKAKELVTHDMLDEAAVRELAAYNAGKLGLDFFGADQVFDVKQKPADGSLTAMHSPSKLVWRGTGACISAAGGYADSNEVVHYVSNPGIVEKWYGPAFPYIVEKLGWMAMTREALDNRGGYHALVSRLEHSGDPRTAPHIGSTIVDRPVERQRVLDRNRNKPENIIASASGTLVEKWVDETYQQIPEYAERAISDEEAGLFDGRIENRRAGLYDVMFAKMTALTLYGNRLDDQMLKVFDPQYYEGVDIN